jgi:hypothetical protein
VRNTNRWTPDGPPEPYALAVVLERDGDHRPLYVELRVALDAQVRSTIREEVPVEGQIELRR